MQNQALNDEELTKTIRSLVASVVDAKDKGTTMPSDDDSDIEVVDHDDADVM